jgi:ribosomal protein L11 methyltransferase
MSWIELEIDVPAAAAEVLADAVGALTGGVEIRDAETILRVGGGRAVIVTQCAPEVEAEVRAELETACTRWREAGIETDSVTVRRREASEDEWRDVWKKHFRALRVGRHFLVRPSWDLIEPGLGDRVIDIDPGRAFGTGGHASTRLVIAMIEELAASPSPPSVRRFLDLGCGSGILSIAAARLWPDARGLALDLDSEAVATTGENLELNRIATVERRVGTLADAGEPVELLLANIEASVLVPLAPSFPAHLAPGATLVLSGLLRSDVEAITSAYADVGLTIVARRDEDEWSALRLERAAAAQGGASAQRK